MPTVHYVYEVHARDRCVKWSPQSIS